MNDACCCVLVDDVECSTRLQDKLVTARKPHRCGECGEQIRPGDQYWLEYVAGRGTIAVYKTCRPCRQIRDDWFSCGWSYEYVRQDFYDCHGWDYCGEWDDAEWLKREEQTA